VPVVNKEARVVEEVEIDKEIGEREEIVRDKLRRTQVDIDEGRRPR
jgi:stress response protein YsnF